MYPLCEYLDLDVQQCGLFIGFFLAAFATGVGIGFLTYCLLAFLLKVSEPHDVYRLRLPWYCGLIVCLFSEIIIFFIWGHFYLDTAFIALSIAGLAWMPGVLAYWILTLIWSPAKVKYTPWLRSTSVIRGLLK